MVLVGVGVGTTGVLVGESDGMSAGAGAGTTGMEVVSGVLLITDMDMETEL